MVRQRPPCFVCTKARGLTDEHHILPVEYGGSEDGKTVPLCTACHRGIHREAESRCKGNSVGLEFRSHLSDLPDDKGISANHTFNVLVNYIVEAKSRHVAEKGLAGKSDTARNMVSASLSEDELRMLHAIKQSLGMTNVSRVLSRLIVEKYVEISTTKRGSRHEEASSINRSKKRSPISHQ